MAAALQECPECHATCEVDTNVCPTCGFSISAHPSGATATGTALGEWNEGGPTTDDQGLFLGRFRDRQLLGAGAFGEVYQGYDVMTGETVAIKVLWPKIAASPQLERFRRETRLARKLAHENIRQVYELSSHEGVYFLTMELLEGVALRDVLRELRSNGRNMPLKRVLSIARGMLRGLGHAHARGVLHRDVKPENIFLIGDDDQVKLLDFSIAKRLDDVHHTVGVGTRFYMAPEQMVDEPEEPVDGRADLFAAGVVLYEMLTGQRPFRSPYSVMLDQVPTAPSTLRQDVPASLDTVVLRALSVRAADRYPRAADMLADLEWIENQEVEAQTWLRGLQEDSARRNRLVGIAAGLVGIAALVWGGFSVERWWWARERMELAAAAHDAMRWVEPEGESELDVLDDILMRRPGYAPALEQRDALFDTLLAAANERLRRGAFDEAEQNMRWLQRMDPDDPRVSSLGTLISTRRDLLEAKLANAEALAELGLFRSDGERAGALDVLDEAAESYPDAVDLAEARGRVEAAEAAALAALEPPAEDEAGVEATDDTAGGLEIVALDEDGSLPPEGVEADAEPPSDPAPGPLERADALIEAYKLTTPAGNNAYELLRGLLAEDPGSAEVRARLARIQSTYLDMATARQRRGALDAALDALRRGASIEPGDPATLRRIARLREEILRQRSARNVVPVPAPDPEPTPPPSEPEPEEEKSFFENLFGL